MDMQPRISESIMLEGTMAPKRSLRIPGLMSILVAFRKGISQPALPHVMEKNGDLKILVVVILTDGLIPIAKHISENEACPNLCWILQSM